MTSDTFHAGIGNVEAVDTAEFSEVSPFADLDKSLSLSASSSVTITLIFVTSDLRFLSRSFRLSATFNLPSFSAAAIDSFKCFI